MNLFEAEILRFIQSTFSSSVFDSIFIFISTLGNKGIIWIFTAVVLTAVKKTRKIGLCCAISLILCLIIGNGILKPIIGRIRPYDFDSSISVIIPHLTDGSFPSGHTLAAFAFTTALTMYIKKYRFILFIPAVLMGLSRIYLCVHYPTDVIAGAVIGIFFGIISYKISERVIKL